MKQAARMSNVLPFVSTASTVSPVRIPWPHGATADMTNFQSTSFTFRTVDGSVLYLSSLASILTWSPLSQLPGLRKQANVAWPSFKLFLGHPQF